MGWRYRKSINLGSGFRINISKSGIGYSWGVPGYRKTWKATGGTRTTYSIPGTGFSYIDESKSPGTTNGRLPRANSMKRYNLENSKTYPVVNGTIDAISTPENALFVKKLKNILVKNFLTWIIGVTLLVVWWFFMDVIPGNIWGISWLSLFCGVIAISLLLRSRRFLRVEYDVDEEIAKIIEKRNNALALLLRCDRLWSIEQYESVVYSRVNAGAKTNYKRIPVLCFYTKAPYYLKVKGDQCFYQIKIRSTRYIFLPDKVLIVGFLKVGALRYHDISVALEDSNFVEDGAAPKDAVFLYHTWQYVNNNGTPDRRFNNNRQLAVYKYEKVYLKSTTGLNLHLMASSVNNARKFKQQWDRLKDIL